jgi:hypothetical protein
MAQLRIKSTCPHCRRPLQIFVEEKQLREMLKRLEEANKKERERLLREGMRVAGIGG